MKFLLILCLSILVVSCKGDSAAENPPIAFVENLEDINTLRSELSASWENWQPTTRNQKDVVIYPEGEIEESHNSDLICHYIYDSIIYTTIWNREAETFDISRELINFTLGENSTEEPGVCNLRANHSSTGDALGLYITPTILLYLDQLGDENSPMPFDTIRPVRMTKALVNGLITWNLTYYIEADIEAVSGLNLKNIKVDKFANSISGDFSVTFASEVPPTAWHLKTSYNFSTSDGQAFGGEEKNVLSINSIFIQ
ncbi:hypothetical protein [Halobacteriovorax sp. HLS]|uniref:hypothetical protein n=1 Tax=Halobacteriovorax sp. HLS TaxID=2234000 RepID=UPI000FD81948|nr:hypothetical protein [Halobacteriovorax sp. HLS]